MDMNVNAPQVISSEVLLEKYCKGAETSISDVRWRVANALAIVEPTADQREVWTERFMDAQSRLGVIMGGRVNSAAGTGLKASLINCFVQPVGDSLTGDEDGLPSIYGALSQAADKTVRMRPLRGDGQRFAGRLAPMYMVRPLFGAAAGLIAYFVLMGLLLLVLTGGSDMSFEPMGLLSVTLATGFFAQTLLERTRQMLDAFFGRAPAASAATGSTNATTAAPAAAPGPVAVPVPAPATQSPAPSSAVQQPQQFGLQGGATGDERG
jgi:hypothetical protein